MCLAWGVARGLLDHNPVIGIKPLTPERRRDRVLSDHEVAAVWKAAADGSEFSTIVRLLLLLGARRDEIGSLGWSELDLEKGQWALPASRSKNRRSNLHRYRRRPPRSFGKSLVATSATSCSVESGGSRGGAEPRTASTTEPKRQRASDWLAGPYTISGARAVTHMAEIGVQPHVIEAIVNHSSGHKGGIAGVYNRAEYATEKRVALQRWADHIEALAAGQGSPSNVVAMRR